MLKDLIDLSRLYGSNPDFVLAGGGNTSVKENGVLYVKESGFRLSDIDQNGFVALDMHRLSEVMNKAYASDEKEAEGQVLADIMASRLPGQTGRPSVEALLHALFPQKYVVHLHPAKINALTCSKNGRAEFETLFGHTALWIDEIKPGYTLATAALQGMREYRKKTGKELSVLFMQNHGIVFAAESAQDIKELVSGVMAKLDAAIKIKPDLNEKEFDREFAAALAPAVRALVCPDGITSFFSYVSLGEFIKGSEHNSCAFTPDHIVYCGHQFCFVNKGENIEQQYKLLREAIEQYTKKNGALPKIVCVEGLGAFACGAGAREAGAAKELFCDAVKIFVYSRNFGGPKLMSEQMISFIKNWEAESYRKSVSAGLKTGKRLSGKVLVITGGAQGFGAGLAQETCEQGANVFIADINEKGAKEFAQKINERYGDGTAEATFCDVSNEESVKALCEDASLRFGGIDVFISNAGILRSGGLEDMDYNTFELVTRVNYSAFFLCAKYSSRVMKILHRLLPERYFDIIQINSKSGLSGSNKNFAYAGGKFGGIGLVQSFAMELAPYNIKVNAICPGNFFDGPLWTDPEKGLFVQYLKAGKVPGAKTVEDVRRAYEEKVPMKRGCEVKDVVRALFYVIEQEYETGQAIPVTGGQNMLK